MAAKTLMRNPSPDNLRKRQSSCHPVLLGQAEKAECPDKGTSSCYPYTISSSRLSKPPVRSIGDHLRTWRSSLCEDKAWPSSTCPLQDKLDHWPTATAKQHPMENVNSQPAKVHPSGRAQVPQHH
ncbi:hypothetical protein RRG08_026058 [Elysia crispata]|uniref:Uncharacterized protein n=1 Tax=Elysia crispata TaxID=231223 RepID=A0AAE1D400_9GAST|nr:hypothetical protein RRG08_026058 [Elysia crispata]